MTTIPAETFKKWDLDILVDYVIKFHHRNVRRYGEKTLNDLNALSLNHHELDKVVDHFRNSVADLDLHCSKEENVLYPYIYDLYNASETHQPIGAFHCGSIQFPINAMMADHDDEKARHERIAELTNNYTAPEGSEPEYQKVLDELRDYRDYLLEHTMIENEIVFPRALALESANAQAI